MTPDLKARAEQVAKTNMQPMSKAAMSQSGPTRAPTPQTPRNGMTIG